MRIIEDSQAGIEGKASEWFQKEKYANVVELGSVLRECLKDEYFSRYFIGERSNCSTVCTDNRIQEKTITT